MKLSQGVHTLLVAGFSLALTACGTVQNYDAAITSWKNAPAEKLYAVWGYPRTIKRLPNGNQVLTYVEVNKIKSPTIVSQNEDKTHAVITGGDVTVYHCTTWFEVNKNQRIVNATFKGNNCSATESYLKSHQYPQAPSQ